MKGDALNLFLPKCQMSTRKKYNGMMTRAISRTHEGLMNVLSLDKELYVHAANGDVPSVKRSVGKLYDKANPLVDAIYKKGLHELLREFVTKEIVDDPIASTMHIPPEAVRFVRKYASLVLHVGIQVVLYAICTCYTLNPLLCRVLGFVFLLKDGYTVYKSSRSEPFVSGPRCSRYSKTKLLMMWKQKNTSGTKAEFESWYGMIQKLGTAVQAVMPTIVTSISVYFIRKACKKYANVELPENKLKAVLFKHYETVRELYNPKTTVDLKALFMDLADVPDKKDLLPIYYKLSFSMHRDLLNPLMNRGLLTNQYGRKQVYS